MVTPKKRLTKNAKRTELPPVRGPSDTLDTGVDLSASKSSSEPLLPNERDEKVGMTGGVPSPAVEQAARDVERGLADTSRGAESDDAYRKLKK